MMVSIAQYQGVLSFPFLNYAPTYNYYYLVGYDSVRAVWLSDLRKTH